MAPRKNRSSSNNSDVEMVLTVSDVHSDAALSTSKPFWSDGNPRGGRSAGRGGLDLEQGLGNGLVDGVGDHDPGDR